jgi:hypothetical protein
MTRTRAFALMAPLLAAACQTAAPPSNAPAATPVYNKDTGRLEQLVSDTNGDGRPDTRGYLDGAAFKHVEIDRNHDGLTDRWEYYEQVAPPPGSGARAQIRLTRAEEVNGSTPRITRTEFYEVGLLARVEEDTDEDGRVDKWETHAKGVLVRMDLDLTGRGRADRRFVYGAGGQVERVDVDPDGDGVFSPAPREQGSVPGARTAAGKEASR